MAKQVLYQASADWVKSAVDALCAAGVEVVAPTQSEPGIVNLTAVTSSEDITLEYTNVTLGLKRLFLPITEVLLEYEKGDNGDVKLQSRAPSSAKEVVVMGSRPCDAAALDVLDKVLQWDYDDVYYRTRRERTTVVSFACSEPASECFCTSVDGSPHNIKQSDVLVFLSNDGTALMEVHTSKGQKFVERLGKVVQPAPAGTTPPEPPQLKREFDPEKVKAWLDEGFESEFWAEDSFRCLGCGSCTYLCPTCHCFDIVDESSWNRGQRRRNWDCCSFAQFTRHASGHNPRPVQETRYRQRIMHKFKYFPERFGQLACVGCGRCLKNCGVGQNLLATLAQIESSQKGAS